MNKVFLIGNLVRDCEVRYTQANLAILSNALVINERYVKDGVKREKTQFIEIVFFGKSAEIINQYCKKGSKIAIDGKIDISDYQTQNGENRKAFKIIVENFELLSFNNEKNHQKGNMSENPTTSNNDKFAKYENNGNGEVIPF